MLLSYKWDGWGWKSLCGATIRASLCDGNNDNDGMMTMMTVSPGVTYVRAYHRPVDGYFFTVFLFEVWISYCGKGRNFLKRKKLCNSELRADLTST